MKLSKCIISGFCFLISLSSNAQYFITTFSVLGNLNNGKYHFLEQAGDYDTKNNKFNLGLGVSTNFYPVKDNNWYLSMGVRLNTTEASIDAVTQIPGISPVQPPISWGYRWQAITIPLHVGKTIVPFSNNPFHINIYGGISYGIIKGSISRYSTIVRKSRDDQEMIGVGLNQDYLDDVFQYRNLMTIDLGLSVTPFRALPGFSLGFVYVYNVQAIKNVRGGGFVANVSQQALQEYFYIFNRRFNNYTFSINYSIGKTKFEKKRRVFTDCFRI